MDVEIRSNDPKIIQTAQDLREAKNLITLTQASEKAARAILLDYMQAFGATKLVAGTNTIHLVEYQRTSVDSMELREKYPQIYFECSQTVTVRSLRVKDI